MRKEKLTQLRHRAVELAQMANPQVGTVLMLVEELQDAGEFGAARRLLDQVRPRIAANDRQRLKLAQRHALCTYKDANLGAGKRYPAALAVLEEIGLRQESCNDAETLGLGGAIRSGCRLATSSR